MSDSEDDDPPRIGGDTPSPPSSDDEEEDNDQSFTPQPAASVKRTGVRIEYDDNDSDSGDDVPIAKKRKQPTAAKKPAAAAAASKDEVPSAVKVVQLDIARDPSPAIRLLRRLPSKQRRQGGGRRGAGPRGGHTEGANGDAAAVAAPVVSGNDAVMTTEPHADNKADNAAAGRRGAGASGSGGGRGKPGRPPGPCRGRGRTPQGMAAAAAAAAVRPRPKFRVITWFTQQQLQRLHHQIALFRKMKKGEFDFQDNNNDNYDNGMAEPAGSEATVAWRLGHSLKQQQQQQQAENLACKRMQRRRRQRQR